MSERKWSLIVLSFVAGALFTLLSVVCVDAALAGNIQDAHKAVIARQGVAESGGADPCATANGTTIFCVDPGVVGGTGDGSSAANAYSSLDTALDTEAAASGDITAIAGGYTFICISSDGTDDTTAVSLNGYTTDADSPVNIVGGDFPSDGIYDGDKYVINAGELNGVGALYIQDQYVTVSNIQILVTEADAVAGDSHGIGMYNIAAGGSDITIDSVIITCGTCSGADGAMGIYANDSDITTLTVKNSLIYGFLSGADAQFKGIQNGAATANLYNNTISGNYLGIVATQTVNVTNCAVFNNTYDFQDAGTLNIVTCASDDGDDGDDGPGTEIDWADEEIDWNANFTSYSTGDFSVKDGDADIDDAGTDLSGSGVTVDIIDTARATHDIGAFELP